MTLGVTILLAIVVAHRVPDPAIYVLVGFVVMLTMAWHLRGLFK